MNPQGALLVVKINEALDLLPHGIFAAGGGRMPTQEKESFGSSEIRKFQKNA